MKFPSGNREDRASRSVGRSGHIRVQGLTRSTLRKRRAALVTASSMAFLGTAAVTVLAAGSAHAATTPLSGMQSRPVVGGAYTLQNNEWGSGAPEIVTTNGKVGFTVTNSSINNATNAAPGGYPSIYAGCHWGNCTSGRAGRPPGPSHHTDQTGDGDDQLENHATRRQRRLRRRLRPVVQPNACHQRPARRRRADGLAEPPRSRPAVRLQGRHGHNRRCLVSGVGRRPAVG